MSGSYLGWKRGKCQYRDCCTWYVLYVRTAVDCAMGFEFGIVVAWLLLGRRPHLSRKEEAACDLLIGEGGRSAWVYCADEMAFSACTAIIQACIKDNVRSACVS